MACVRARMAVQRATRRARIISTRSSPALGTALASPESTVRAAASASVRSDLPRRRRVWGLGHDLDDEVAAAAQEARQPGAIAARALEAERLELTQFVPPAKQLSKSRCRCVHGDGPEPSAEVV